MDLSVVVPTLNGRAQLVRCLDALSEHAPGVEVVVVNGPSTDGTTGMVREREDIDVLVEIADRNINVARNAGIGRASGEWIAFVSDEYSIEAGWFDALHETSGADATDEPDSRLRRVLPTPLVSAVSAAARTTRAVAVRSKRLVPGTRADSRVDGDGGRTDDPIDGVSIDDQNATEGGFDTESGPVGAVTGPTHRELVGGTTTQSPESRSVAGRSVTYFNPDNVAVSREALRATDGFDEYLQVGGARDLAHRLAAGEYAVAWAGGMCVRGEYGADGTGRNSRWRARALAYRLVKNYGVRPSVARRMIGAAGTDVVSDGRRVLSGEVAPSGWFATNRDTIVGSVVGTSDGLRARWRDRDRHNPNGYSARADRAVEVYDRR